MEVLTFLRVSLLLQMMVTISVGRKELLLLDKSPDLSEKMVKIIKSCYGERIKTIGLAGSLSNSFITSLSSDETFDIVMLSGDEKPSQSDVVSIMARYKLQMFIITTRSPLAFKNILVHIRDSRWWNHLAQFYVFQSPDERNGCSKAIEFLWAAWTMDILGLKFICDRGDEGSLIYMFNPYAKHAPAPWELVRTQEGVNGHPWTLFARKYDENVEVICANLDFDQTSDAGGYEVRITATKGYVISNASKPCEYSPYQITNQKLCAMSRYMNVIIKMVIRPQNSTVGFVDENGKSHGMVTDLTNARSEMVLRPAPLTAVPELPAGYPSFVKFFAVTQYTGYPSQWEKVTTAIDYSSRVGVGIVTIVTVVFLKCALRQSFMVAFLNSLRVIICNGSFTKLPNNLGPRIYLTCLLFFVIIIQALYQGQLAARLSEHVRYPNVNNKQDLINSHYVIYGRDSDAVFFSEEAYEGRFVAKNVDGMFCPKFVVRNSSLVCVGGKEYLMNATIASKLHMSMNAVVEFPMKNVIRENWPLEARFNRHNSYYEESGTETHDCEVPFREASHILDVNENGSGDDDYKVLNLSDLAFAFVILGIGLACAIVSSVIEQCVARAPSSQEKYKCCLLVFTKK